MTTDSCAIGVEIGGNCSPARNTISVRKNPDGTPSLYCTFPSDGEEHLTHVGTNICELHTQLFLGTIEELATTGELEGRMRYSRDGVTEEHLWSADGHVVLQV